MFRGDRSRGSFPLAPWIRALSHPADTREAAWPALGFGFFLSTFDSFIVKVLCACELDPRKSGRRDINEYFGSWKSCLRCRTTQLH